MNNKERIDALIGKVLADASERKANAAYGGSMSDGGARQLEMQVEYYSMGMRNEIPADWEEVYGKLLDPEYENYLRLKKKFG
jgi:hypothetical protein